MDKRNSEKDGSPKDPQNRTRKVRSRTMRRLRKLLVAGAASGAAIQSGCTKSISYDPAPPPLVCHENMTERDYEEPGAFSASATWDFEWTTDHWQIEVNVRISYWGGDPLVFTGDPQITDATMVEFTRTEFSVSFTCEPHDDATSIQVTVPMDCDGHADWLRFDLDVSGERWRGQSIPMDGPFEYYPYY